MKMPANMFAGIRPAAVHRLSPLTQVDTINFHSHSPRLDGIEPQWLFGSTAVVDAISELMHQTQTETTDV